MFFPAHRHAPGRTQPWQARRVAAAAALALAGLALAGSAQARDRERDRDRDDHDRARAAVQAGQVMPLPALMARLARSHPGQVLELELESDDGRWVYEVKLLQADGLLLKLALDARTGELLSSRRKGDKRKEDAR